ncbi:YceI family protein [Mucilaginibacter boryungensis]|uniref:YceI family protein n=1 Tax=Mucilaginibacter boryungensis TaxID=768480 RepID=A0ABR9XMP6_9SPHI|nr:YceI family protein [Mucilaginibacter boryungensis]MBE9668525.1 YceI family protein [Mucilaginibacter boryungensis]
MRFANLGWLMMLLLLTGFTSTRKTADPGDAEKWLINKTSSLTINGSTNINKFACDIPGYGQTDTLTLTKERGNIALSGTVVLKIRSFDCHNAIMTNDLRKTLKEPLIPVLRISFLSLSKMPAHAIQLEIITGLVDIELAGMKKRFEIAYQVSTDSQREIHLLGTRDVTFTDFNLIPPRKLGGMIKTNDKLSITFHLAITRFDKSKVAT